MQQNEKQEKQLNELIVRETQLKDLLDKARLETETHKAQSALLTTQHEEQKERAEKAEQDNASLHEFIAKQAEELGAANANLAALSKQATELKY